MNSNNTSDLEKLNDILNDGLKVEYVDEEETVIRINDNPRKEFVYQNDQWHHNSDRKSWEFESIKELGEHINYKEIST